MHGPCAGPVCACSIHRLYLFFDRRSSHACVVTRTYLPPRHIQHSVDDVCSTKPLCLVTTCSDQQAASQHASWRAGRGQQQQRAPRRRPRDRPSRPAGSELKVIKLVVETTAGLNRRLHPRRRSEGRGTTRTPHRSAAAAVDQAAPFRQPACEGAAAAPAPCHHAQTSALSALPTCHACMRPHTHTPCALWNPSAPPVCAARAAACRLAGVDSTPDLHGHQLIPAAARMPPCSRLADKLRALVSCMSAGRCSCRTSHAHGARCWPAAAATAARRQPSPCRWLRLLRTCC